MLGSSGYATAMSGKWHVTTRVLPDEDKSNWPRQRGFDRFYGIVSGAASYWDPWSLTRDNTRISAFADPDYDAAEMPEGAPYYFTDAVTDHAVKYIKEQPAEQPQFLYVAYTAGHWPMHARPRDIAHYKGRYDAGYGPARDARMKKMRSLGLLGSDAELSPQAWEWGKVDTEWDASLMEIYAAMVTSMDRGIGRIVDTLRESGKLDNTLILYCQDNGGCAEGFGRKVRAANERGGPIIAGPRPDAPTMQPLPDEAFIGSMVPPQTRDGYPIRGGVHATSGGPDTYIAYGQGWANVSNTPFREYKHYVHEGGIATPLIAHWPAGIKTPARLDDTPSHLVDVMATAIDLSGATYPKDKKVRPVAGASLRPIFDEGVLEPRQLFWEHEGNRAVREGKWKLVAMEGQPWELYDIETDRSELHDLAGQHLDLVTRLSDDWYRWATRDAVLPLSGWRSKKVAKRSGK